MATLTLEEDWLEQADLPELCIKCGAPATLRQEKTFRWFPPWVLVFLLLGAGGVLICVVAAILAMKKRRLEVPLCEDHRHHWGRRQGLLLITFGLLMLVALVALVFLIEADLDPAQNEPLGGILCAGT